MERKLVYLINPISGTKNKNSLVRLLKEKTELAGINYQILPTDPEGNYIHLKEIIKSESITDVIVCGGDGSINQAVGTLKDCPVIFGVIPMGSGNGLAYAAKIPRSVSRAIDIILLGQHKWVDAFTLNEKFSCMLSGVGIDANIAHEFAKQKKRGLITYLKQSFKNYLSAKPYRFTIQMDNTEMETEAYFISIANSNQFGNYVTIAPKASLSDGLLDIIVVHKMNKIKLAFEIVIQLKLGKVIPFTSRANKSGIGYYQSKEIMILNHGMAPLHVDGEPIDCTSVIKVKIIEKAFRLIHG